MCSLCWFFEILTLKKYSNFKNCFSSHFLHFYEQVCKFAQKTDYIYYLGSAKTPTFGLFLGGCRFFAIIPRKTLSDHFQTTFNRFFGQKVVQKSMSHVHQIPKKPPKAVCYIELAWRTLSLRTQTLNPYHCQKPIANDIPKPKPVILTLSLTPDANAGTVLTLNT